MASHEPTVESAISSAISAVFARHESPADFLWRPLLRLLAGGQPVAISELAAATGREIGEVAQALQTLADTEYDDAGRIVGYGISLRPTPHRFTIDNRLLHTWCALDTLVFPAILDTAASVESPCHHSGRPVRCTVEPDGVRDVEPATAVVSVVVPGDMASVRTSFCAQVHFFADAEAARPWLAEHPGASVLPVAQAHELGHRLIAD